MPQPILVEAETEQFYEEQDLLELTPKKKDVKYQNEYATSKYTRHTGIHFDIWQN